MSLCALCGHQTFGGELCHYHDTNRSVNRPGFSGDPVT
jgi:hypothetical protein